MSLEHSPYRRVLSLDCLVSIVGAGLEHKERCPACIIVYVCTYYRRLLYFTALSLHSLELTLGVALDTPEVHTGMYVDLFYGTKKFETNYIDNTTGYGFCTVHCSRGRRGRNRICR